MATCMVPLGLTLLCAAPAPVSAGSVTIFGGGGFDFSVPVTSVREARFRNVIRQEYDFSCGSASVATLLTYHYGIPTEENEVFTSMLENGDQEIIRTRGFPMLDMKNYLEAHGFTADGYETGLETLEEAGIPAIVLINLNGYMHFVVIKGVNENEVLVGDPAFGVRVYSRDEFHDMWNGILFVVTSHMEEGQERFNVARDWQIRHAAPLGTALSNESLSLFSMMLPLPGEF